MVSALFGGVDGVGVEEGERGGVRVGEGEKWRRAVIVWWCGGRLPERDPTPLSVRRAVVLDGGDGSLQRGLAAGWFMDP